jgi:hypothetical protein
VGEFLDEPSRKALRDSLDRPAGPALGKNLRELLPYIGPDVGMYVAAPPAGDKNWFPQALWAVRVRSNPTGKPVERTLMDALNAFANLAVLDHNSKHDDRIDLKTVQQDKIEVKYFVNEKFPAGFQPAYALKDGYLLVASSPEVIRRFQASPPAPAASDLAAEVPLARWSLVALRSYLKDHREPLAAAAEKDKPKEQAAADLDKLQSVLQLIDTVELTQRPTPGQVILTLRIKPSLPLKK